MSLIIATGSNIGDRKENLTKALSYLQKYFNLISQSKIYKSAAVDYEDQPEFYNQLLEFSIPTELSKDQTMVKLLEIEK